MVRALFLVILSSFAVSSVMADSVMADNVMPPKSPKAQASQPPTANIKGEYGDTHFSASGAVGVSSAYSEGEVIVKSTVAEVCPKKGCWMKVQGARPGEQVRVTFKDYGFFVPIDLVGKEVALQGRYIKHTESVEEQKHLLQDAKRPQAEIDAIKKPKETLRFIATGVKDLSKSK